MKKENFEAPEKKFDSFAAIAKHNRDNGWVPVWKCPACDGVILWDNEETQPEHCNTKMILDGIEPETVN